MKLQLYTTKCNLCGDVLAYFLQPPEVQPDCYCYTCMADIAHSMDFLSEARRDVSRIDLMQSTPDIKRYEKSGKFRRGLNEATLVRKNVKQGLHVEELKGFLHFKK